MIKLRRQNRFKVEDPEELRRQLHSLEDAIEEMARQLEAATLPRGKRYDVHSGETVNAVIGGLYVCDTGLSGDAIIILPRMRPEYENCFIYVWKTTDVGAVILRPVDALIDDAVTASVTSKAHYDISSDGRNYRREF